MAKKIKNTFDFKSIKSFEDACKTLGLNPDVLPNTEGITDEFKKPIIAQYKLMVIFKAINNGWKPNWGDSDEYKYYPWYYMLSSGFGFDGSDYSFTDAGTYVGSRLCTDTSEKAMYIAKIFEQEYKELYLFNQ